MKKGNQMADRLVRGLRNAKGSTVSKQPSKTTPRKPTPRKPATGKTSTGKTVSRDELHPERIWPD